MKLLDHLKSTDESVESFAGRLGEAVTTIRKIAYRQRQPSLPLAVKIERATNGAVTPAEMVLDAAAVRCSRCGEHVTPADAASCGATCPMRAAQAA